MNLCYQGSTFLIVALLLLSHNYKKLSYLIYPAVCMLYTRQMIRLLDFDQTKPLLDNIEDDQRMTMYEWGNLVI